MQYLPAQEFELKEKEILNKIDNELIKAKLSYESRDSAIFNDIEEVIASLRVTTQYDYPSKIKYYEFIYALVKDMNNNLYANKKIEDRDYRRAIRFMPSVFYYIKQGLLAQFLHQYPLEANKTLIYIQSEPDVKNYIVQLGLESPTSFYSQIDEFNSFTEFPSILQTLATFDPYTWVIQVEKNPYLMELAKQSNSPYIKKVMEIRSRMSTNSTLYYYLDDIIKNSFNDTHEWEFTSNKYILTKKLLAATNDPNAYARISATNYLANVGKWVFEEFLDDGEAVFSQFSTNEIFTLLVLCHQHLEYEDLLAVLKYLKKYDDVLISNSTLISLPQNRLNSFLKKVEKADLLEGMKNILEVEAVTYVHSKMIELNEKLALQHQDWFTNSYNYDKEKQERQVNKNKAIAATFHLNKSQMSLLSWARNINKVDSNINSIIKSSIGNRFVDYLAAYHPHILLNNREKLKQLAEFPNIVNKIAYFSPNSIKKYLGSPDNDITKQIHLSHEPIPKLILTIFNLYKFNSKAYALIHKIIHKEISVEEANRLGNTEVPYLKALMNITIQKNPIGIHSVEEEQNQISLKFIREINDNPSNSHPNLQEIRNFNAKEIYSLMVLGKEEIFQFAFDNCYRVLNQQIGESNFIDFLPQVNYYKYREFSTLLANFGKFPELLYRNTTQEARVAFLENMTHIDFSDVKCIEQAAVLCEFINNCDHSEIQTIIQNKIYAEYIDAESRKDQLAMAVYSLLGSNIGQRALVHQDWYISMKSKYSKYTLSYIDVNDIKNKQNRIIEVCYFYNDADGVASFNSYINTFKSMSKWYLQDLGSYYYISSLEGNDYDIFANKPQYEQLGQQAMRDYLIYNKLEPSIIVHRGHSYHSQKTIDQLIGSPKFIFMGSCGGYYKISELLVRSPNAQILSTKQVGTMGINDPMLRSIHELLRLNQNIDWPTFWAQQELKLRSNKDFKMYIPPHKNNGALFVNAFFKVVGF